MIRMQIGVFVACLLALALSVAPADARKKAVAGGVTCNCQCHSDQRNQSGLPMYSESISFAEQSSSSCYAHSSVTGCRVKNGQGAFVPGTLRLCSYTTNPASTNNAGVDGGAGHTGTQPFALPGHQLLQP